AGCRDRWASLLRANPGAIYVEAMTNPLLEVADLEGVVQFAREHGLISIIDNTFATPVNYRPLTAGFDLCLHSATKYLNGHADIVGGVVSGRSEMIEQITHNLNHFVASLHPPAAFLFPRPPH